MSKLPYTQTANDQTSHFSVSGTAESGRIASGAIQLGVPTNPLRLAPDMDIETASEHLQSQFGHNKTEKKCANQHEVASIVM